MGVTRVEAGLGWEVEVVMAPRAAAAMAATGEQMGTEHSAVETVRVVSVTGAEEEMGREAVEREVVDLATAILEALLVTEATATVGVAGMAREDPARVVVEGAVAAMETAERAGVHSPPLLVSDERTTAERRCACQ